MMSKGGWSSRVILRYALFQVPSYLLLILLIFIIRQWINIPTWAIISIIAVWFTKDVFIFPSVWRAYDMSNQINAQSIIGMQGTVEKELAPSGYVKVHGELWKATLIEANKPVKRGEKIEVKEIRGLTLLVKDINNSEEEI
jgi:membrane-bound ClpP family serine protease